jgi:molybdopterin/thiamine biosynthesis adenylyltransferase
MMKKSEPFLATAKGLLMKFKDERNMLFMAERINLIDELYNWVPANSKSRFYRSASMEELKGQVTFTTPGKCRDGVDAPWKDCIVITSPIANIEQLTGRVIREAENKKQPIIIDMVDYGCTRIAQTVHSRIKFYENKNWDVQYIIVKDGVMREIEQDQAISIIRGANEG